MNVTEASKFLAMVAAYDNRRVTEQAAQAWAGALPHIDPAEAWAAAQEHFATSTDYLLPAHITAGVRRAHEAKIREEAHHRQLGARADWLAPDLHDSDAVRTAKASIRRDIVRAHARWSGATAPARTGGS